MKSRRLFSSTLALSAALAAPSFADVTAADVWANQTAYLDALGIRANGTLEGDALTGIELNAVLPMGAGSFQIKTSDVTLAENRDGSVSIVYPSPMEVTVSGAIGGAGSFSAQVLMTHDGYDVNASGNPGEVTYEANADMMRLEIRELNLPAEMGAIDLAGFVTVEDSDWTSTITEGNLINVDNQMRIGRTTTQMIVTEPSGMAATTEQSTAPMTSSVQASLPRGGSDLLNLSQALRNGLSLNFESSGEGSTSETITTQNGAVMSQQGNSIGQQTASGSFTQDGFVITGEASDFALSIEDTNVLPLPIKASIADISADYIIPVNAADDPQDFRLAIGFGGITIDEALWGMFDPAAQLPRDPADVSFNITGDGMLGMDLLDFMAMAGLQSAPPITVDQVTVNDLRIAAVGAEATAQGSMTFDWTDFTTIPGMARPEGDVTINVDGANGLLDTLTSMGILTDEDSMGARMMMGIFATPTGDDALTSKIEINEQGHILANGQRIR